MNRFVFMTIIVLLSFLFISCMTTKIETTNPDLRDKIIAFGETDEYLLVYLPREITETNQLLKAEGIKVSNDTIIIGKEGKRIKSTNLRYSEVVEIWLSEEDGKSVIDRWPIAKQIKVLETNENKNNDLPKDFNFLLRYGVKGRNVLNTFENTYIKDLVDAGTITIKMTLDKSEMREIYEKMLEVDIFSYPNNFEPLEPHLVKKVGFPNSTYELIIEMDGNKKEVYWDTPVITETIEEEMLRDLIYFIVYIVELKEEFKKLPAHVSGYD
ncbi:MAG: hypothetical protein APF76_12770 [Desulfitibacter sp. BRH_c19]|nr:MAG: hypothetical protein APF76_12770 [Desulfitibacter sp. BRH_c19]